MHPSYCGSNGKSRVKQLVADLQGHQQKLLALCVFRIIVSGSSVLQRIAESLSKVWLSLAKMASIERRLTRFVANHRIASLISSWPLRKHGTKM
jgi:hypothetical protein